jgi:hypothetical protein
VDRNRVDANPDPDFYVDADPDPDRDWHQNDADPHADPTPSFTRWKISFFLLFVTALEVYNV